MAGMVLDGAPWIPLTADRIETLPETSAVFEVANLVRNILFIGSSQGNLRAAVSALTQVPGRLPSSAGGLYIRWTTTEQEPDLLAERLRNFASRHHGDAPQLNRQPVRALGAARAQQVAA